MEMDTIKTKYNILNQELKQALSTMEYSDRVITIKESIKELQDICPHNNGSYDFSITENCPYCGKKFRK